MQNTEHVRLATLHSATMKKLPLPSPTVCAFVQTDEEDEGAPRKRAKRRLKSERCNVSAVILALAIGVVDKAVVCACIQASVANLSGHSR